MRSTEANRIRREMDKLLADAGERQGEELHWDQADEKLLGMLQDHVDREVSLTERLAAATDSVRLQIALSTEIRLTQSSIARLLRQIRESIPQQQEQAAPMSPVSRKASKALSSHWRREALRKNAIASGKLPSSAG